MDLRCQEVPLHSPHGALALLTNAKMLKKNQLFDRVHAMSPFWVAVAIFIYLSLGWLIPVEGKGGTGNIQFGDKASSGAVQPTDDNQVSPASIRFNYGKRFPYAMEQAQSDRVENQESASGSPQSYSAYGEVHQYCIGGYLALFNEADDQLQQATETAKDCYQSTLDALNKRIADDKKKIEDAKKVIKTFEDCQKKGMYQNSGSWFSQFPKANEQPCLDAQSHYGEAQNALKEATKDLADAEQKKVCVEAELPRLQGLLDQISKLNRQDLKKQLKQQLGLTQIKASDGAGCQTLCDPSSNDLGGISGGISGMSGYGSTHSVLGQVENIQNGPILKIFRDKLIGLVEKSTGKTLLESTLSTETNNKACTFKNVMSDTWMKPHTPNHFFYVQEPQTSTVTLPTGRDAEALEVGTIPVVGLPVTDTQFQEIDRNNKQRLLEIMFDPERWTWTQTAAGHMQVASMANSVGGAAETGFKTACNAITSTLVNIANENSADSTMSKSGHRTLRQAIYIVQRMYREVFLPLAVLFLLPGALLTQVKSFVSQGLLGGGEDSSSPFEGIVRAVIAIFLIPATQMIVSYSIDIGNSLTDSVRDPAQGWIQQKKLIDWAKEQTFNPSPANANNGMFIGLGQGGGAQAQSPADELSAASAVSGSGKMPEKVVNAPIDVGKFFGANAKNPAVSMLNFILNSLFGNQINSFIDSAQGGASGGAQGKSAGQLEESVVQENQLWLSSAMQLGFNGAAYLMGQALTILTAYQLVFMCYLFLLGPLAACFFAWPSGIGGLFRKVFGNWLDAVVVLSLWRFYWCVILAVMTQRIIYLHPNPGSASEMMVFNCFLALLLYVPFQPFSFSPGPIVSQVLDKAAQAGKAGGGQGPSSTSPGTGAGNAERSVSTPSSSGLQHSPASPLSGNMVAAKPTSAVSASNINLVDVGQEKRLTGQDIAPPASSADVGDKSRKGTGEHSIASGLPQLTAVAGNEVDPGLPPIVSSQGNQAASQTLLDTCMRQGLSSAKVEAIGHSTAPTVALAPKNNDVKVLLNTGNATHAQMGVKAWQDTFSRVVREESDSGLPASSATASSASGVKDIVGLGTGLTDAKASYPQFGDTAAAMPDKNLQVDINLTSNDSLRVEGPAMPPPGVQRKDKLDDT